MRMQNQRSLKPVFESKQCWCSTNARRQTVPRRRWEWWWIRCFAPSQNRVERLPETSVLVEFAACDRQNRLIFCSTRRCEVLSACSHASLDALKDVAVGRLRELDPSMRLLRISSFMAVRLAERHSSSFHGSDCRTRYVFVVTGIKSSNIVAMTWLYCDATSSSTSRSVPVVSSVEWDDERRALRNCATSRFFHSRR